MSRDQILVQVVSSKLNYWLNYYSAVNESRGRSVAELTMLVGQSVPGLSNLGHQILKRLITDIVDNPDSLFQRTDEQVWIEYPDLASAPIIAIAEKAVAVPGLALDAIANTHEVLDGFPWIKPEHQPPWTDFVDACKNIMKPLRQAYQLLSEYKLQMNISAAMKSDVEYAKLTILVTVDVLRNRFSQTLNGDEARPIRIGGLRLKTIHQSLTKTS